MVNIVTPKVYLIAHNTLQFREMSNFFVDHVRADMQLEGYSPEHICEVAGRLCYMSYGKGRKTNKEFLDNILASKHGSVLEHASFTFLITGVSRSFTHELVRHRHLSFSQLSQRYVDESEANFVRPANMDCVTPNENQYWQDTLGAAQATYKRIAQEIEDAGLSKEKTLNRKLARQTARSVLPNAVETKICVTGNARAWRHFLNVRGSLHADTEIREVAILLLDKLKERSPNLFGDFIVENGEIKSTYGSV